MAEKNGCGWFRKETGALSRNNSPENARFRFGARAFRRDGRSVLADEPSQENKRERCFRYAVAALPEGCAPC